MTRSVRSTIFPQSSNGELEMVMRMRMRMRMRMTPICMHDSPSEPLEHCTTRAQDQTSRNLDRPSPRQALNGTFLSTTTTSCTTRRRSLCGELSPPRLQQCRTPFSRNSQSRLTSSSPLAQSVAQSSRNTNVSLSTMMAPFLP